MKTEEEIERKEPEGKSASSSSSASASVSASASSSDPELDVWIPYSERPEWKDVEPIPQTDEDNVVKILYSDRFRDIYDYFRAIYVSKEISQRALELTKDAAEANPANYTVWHHRRFLLRELKADLCEELKFCRQIMEEHPKNYQIWEHRRKLIDWLQDPSKELKLTEIILSNDAKNYHAWQHRQWVMTTFNMFDGELVYVDRLLEDDIRNNSAWNQRFFVLKMTSPNGIIKGETLQREINYSMKAIEKLPSNESSWNFITGLMNQCVEEEIEQVRKQVMDFCYELHENRGIKNHYLFAAMVDVHTNAMEFSSGDIDHHLKKATEMCHDLATEYDTIRKEYWSFLERYLTERFSKKETG